MYYGVRFLKNKKEDKEEVVVEKKLFLYFVYYTLTRSANPLNSIEIPHQIPAASSPINLQIKVCGAWIPISLNQVVGIRDAQLYYTKT